MTERLYCEKKDCDYFDKEKNECALYGLWNGCSTWMGFDGWNYTKNGKFVDGYR